MDVLGLFATACALSMDAFAVALCKGLCFKSLQWKQVGLVALFFGGFQAFMPLIGWALGTRFEGYITAIDHWVAFALLVGIGGKMVWEALHKAEEASEEACDTLNIRELFIMAVATSIDALAVGIIFAIEHTDILPSVALIGVVTFVLSALGVVIGHRFGAKITQKAELGGGVVLVGIGVKILLEHLGVF